MYNVYYSADEMMDDSGDKQDIGFDLKVYAFVNRVIWVSKYEILGGNFFADALIPLIYTDIKIDAAEIDDDKFGMGDPCVEPFGIAWHGAQYDAAMAVGGYVPLGEYDKNEPAASPGKDMWTAMFTGGGTVYFDREKTWSASILARYEIHSEKKELDYTPGDDFHFEWGLAKTFNKTIDIGLAGYAEWQVTDDSGENGNDTKNRVYAVGPEVNFFFPKYLLFASLRTEFEFGAENQQEGFIAALTLTKGF
jgi:hypothetical protein